MKTATTRHHLEVARAAEIAPAAGDQGPAWLVEHLWSSGAVGVVGGAPKSVPRLTPRGLLFRWLGA